MKINSLTDSSSLSRVLALKRAPCPRGSGEDRETDRETQSPNMPSADLMSIHRSLCGEERERRHTKSGYPSCRDTRARTPPQDRRGGETHREREDRGSFSSRPPRPEANSLSLTVGRTSTTLTRYSIGYFFLLSPPSALVAALLMSLAGALRVSLSLSRPCVKSLMHFDTPAPWFGLGSIASMINQALWAQARVYFIFLQQIRREQRRIAMEACPMWET